MPGKDNIVDVHNFSEKMKEDLERLKNANPNSGPAGQDPRVAERRKAQDVAIDAMKNVSSKTEELGKEYGVDVKHGVKPTTAPATDSKAPEEPTTPSPSAPKHP